MIKALIPNMSGLFLWLASWSPTVLLIGLFRAVIDLSANPHLTCHFSV